MLHTKSSSLWSRLKGLLGKPLGNLTAGATNTTALAKYFSSKSEEMVRLRKAKPFATVADYEIVKIIDGGQGQVSIGRKGELFHAIKKYHIDDGASYGNRSILNEALSGHYIGSGTRSAWGVLPLLGISCEGPLLVRLSEITYFSITPFCQHGSLADRIQTSAISEEECISHLLGLITAIDDIHRAGFAHLDIKPSNIMFWDGKNTGVDIRDFEIKIVLGDLGSARRISASNAHVSPFTPAYASPEQERGEESSWPSDIWAWGVVAHELSVGHVPVKNYEENESNESTLGAKPHAAQDISIDTRIDALPNWLSAVIRNALSIDATKRPTSAEILRLFSKHVNVSGKGSADVDAIRFDNFSLAAHLHRYLGWPKAESQQSVHVIVKITPATVCRDAMTFLQIGLEGSLRMGLATIEEHYGPFESTESIVGRFLRGLPPPDNSKLIDVDDRLIAKMPWTDVLTEVAIDVAVRILYSLVETYGNEADLAKIEMLSSSWHESRRLSTTEHMITCAQGLMISRQSVKAFDLMGEIDGSKSDSDEQIRALKTMEYIHLSNENITAAARTNAVMAKVVMSMGEKLQALHLVAAAAILSHFVGNEKVDEMLDEFGLKREHLSSIDMFAAMNLIERAESSDPDKEGWSAFRPHLHENYFKPNTSVLKGLVGLQCALLYGDQDFARRGATRFISAPANALPMHHYFYKQLTDIAAG